MAERQINQHENEDLIPSNCHKNIFSTFAFDNDDMSEETLSGIGTTPCTNGIVIQRSVDTCAQDQMTKKLIFPKSGLLKIFIFRYCHTVQRKELTQKLFH